MNQQVQGIIDSLEKIVSTIHDIHPSSSTNENIQKPLNVVINSNFPPLSKQQIYDFIQLETKRLENLNVAFTPSFLGILDELSTYIDAERNTIGALFNQANPQFFDKIVQLVTIVNITFQQYLDWEHVADTKKIPKELKQRVTTIQNSLNEVEESSAGIQSKVKSINEAYDTATELPVLLEDLKRSRSEIDLVQTRSSENLTKIQNNKSISDTDLNSIKTSKEQAEKLLEEAKNVLKQMQDKLTTSTGIGLAHAFSNRSKELRNTSWVWTGGFIVSLACTFYIAFHRFNDLKDLINQDTPISFAIIQIIISLISLSAPVWFAIISSKQIQKLFTLSEDYAYKASISASYEGYRQEAYDVDSELVKKLLTTALTKVDEAPLRLVGKEQSSSPFEELINQPQIKQLIEAFPETKERLLNIFTKDESPKKEKKTPIIQDDTSEGEAEQKAV